MPSRECPLCGGSMQLKEIKTADRIPGHPGTIARSTFEWICPDCDYFEEEGEGKGS